MGIFCLEEMTWTEVRSIDRKKLVAILPIGALEAHGPHLPIATDIIISNHLACLTAIKLSALDYDVMLLPSISYTIAEFAKSFTGTVSILDSAFRNMLGSICNNLRLMKLRYLLVANSHLDPVHLKALHAVFDICTDPVVIFPDKTDRRWAKMLTDEFRSGSCHAGQYETSLVLASRPELVKSLYKSTKAKFVNLAEKIKSGAKSFNEIDMLEAYCGDPAKATVEEGKKTFDKLSNILVTAFVERVGTK
ncbi:MAG: creatininase family protein [Planctomycetes bacterium]|nr:creatininase family protein [Planctomycetota bacterium]